MALCRLDSLLFVRALLGAVDGALAAAQRASRNPAPFADMAEELARLGETLKALGARSVPPDGLRACTLLHQARYAVLAARDLCDQYEDPEAPAPPVFSEPYNAQLRRTLAALDAVSEALLLWETGAEKGIPPRVQIDLLGRPAIDYARQHSDLNGVKRLQDVLRANRADSPHPGQARASQGHWLKVEAQLYAAPINDYGKYYTLLHMAVMYQDCFAVAMLLARKADIEAPTKGQHLFPPGTTPLGIAVTLGSVPVTRLLLAWGAAPAPARKVPTNAACQALVTDPAYVTKWVQEACTKAYNGQFDELRDILSVHHLPLDVKFQPTSRYFLIHQVAYWGNLDLYHQLREGGAAPLLRSADDLLPAAVAASNGQRAAAVEVEEDQSREKLSRPEPLTESFPTPTAASPMRYTSMHSPEMSPARRRIMGDDSAATSPNRSPKRATSKTVRQERSESPDEGLTFTRSVSAAFGKVCKKFQSSSSASNTQRQRARSTDAARTVR